MIEYVMGWPPEALTALAALVLSNGVMGIKAIQSWRSSASAVDAEIHKQGWHVATMKEETIERLRRLLDRGRRRENALATGFEIVVLVLPETLTPQQVAAVKRARELFETALLNAGSEDVK